VNIKPLELKLKSVACHIGGEANAEYDVAFQDLDNRTVITERIKMHVANGTAALELNVSGCIAPTADEALNKMADWLEGLAETIRKRNKAENTIPIY
jgi:hypothetical protein